MHDVDPGPWQFCSAGGINNKGMAAGSDGNVGAYWSSTTGVSHTGLLSPTDSSSTVLGLNDNGLLAGTSGGKAFVFDTNTSEIYDLNVYLPAGSPFSQLTELTDINNTNEFVGIGLIDGVEHGFVGQIVVPEPGTGALLAALAIAGSLGSPASGGTTANLGPTAVDAVMADASLVFDRSDDIEIGGRKRDGRKRDRY